MRKIDKLFILTKNGSIQMTLQENFSKKCQTKGPSTKDRIIMHAQFFQDWFENIPKIVFSFAVFLVLSKVPSLK